MVEFPLVARRSARGLRRRLDIYLRSPRFADINFASSNRGLFPSDMWETNTFAASFHARLNVALVEDSRAKAGLTLPCRRYNLSQIPQHAGRLLVQGQQRPGESEPDGDDQGRGDHAGRAAGLPDEAQRHDP